MIQRKNPARKNIGTSVLPSADGNKGCVSFKLPFERGGGKILYNSAEGCGLSVSKGYKIKNIPLRKI